MNDYSRRERLFLVLASAFVVVLVLTNVIGVKLFQAPFNPEFALTTGILTYPITFLITDIVSEVYGKKRADFMVAVGFGMSVLMMVILMVAIAVPPHEYWVAPVNPYYPDAAGYQHAYSSVFALNGILLFGSMSAFLCAQLTDNWLFHRLRRLTGGRHLWLRNNGSTWVSQLVDTIVVNSILFYIGLVWTSWSALKLWPRFTSTKSLSRHWIHHLSIWAFGYSESLVSSQPLNPYKKLS